MLSTPKEVIRAAPTCRYCRTLESFAPLFSRRMWRHVPLLVVGAILTPGRRMVSSVLRTVGLSQERHFPNLSSRPQPSHLVEPESQSHSVPAARRTFAPNGPLVLGIDETIERRRGAKIAAAGIYRDPVRSSHSHFVKVNGLRWVCLMLLVPIPWAGRVWALPFLSALAPSERYAPVHGRPAQTGHALGAATHSARASLAPGPLVGGCRRPRLRRPRPA